MGGGVFKYKTRQQAPAAFKIEISDKAHSESRDVETTSSCSSRCAGLATREVQSEASTRSRRPPPQKCSPTQDAVSSGAAACAHRRQQNNPGLNPEAGLNSRRGTQLGSGTQPEKVKELLMVGVPRTHSAGPLLQNLVMVGVPRTHSPWMRRSNLLPLRVRGSSQYASLIQGARVAELEFRQLQYASEADVSRAHICVHIRC